MSDNMDEKKQHEGVEGSLKRMRTSLANASKERSMKRALGNLRAAQREADPIRFGPGLFSENEGREAFGISEILSTTFNRWILSKYEITKDDIKEAAETLLSPPKPSPRIKTRPR